MDTGNLTDKEKTAFLDGFEIGARAVADVMDWMFRLSGLDPEGFEVAEEIDRGKGLMLELYSKGGKPEVMAHIAKRMAMLK